VPLALDVLLPLPLTPLRWLVPYGVEVRSVGARVVVPWQRGVRIGLVTGMEEVGDARSLELREAIAWLEDGAPLPAATVTWLLAEAERTVTPAGVILASLSLGTLRSDLDHDVRLLAHGQDGESAWQAADTAEGGEMRIDELREQGLLEERVTIRVPTRRVLVPNAEPTDPRLEGARKQAQRGALKTLQALGQAESGVALARAADVPESSVRTLLRNGFARYEAQPAPPPDVTLAPPPEPLPVDAPAEVRKAEDAPSVITGGTLAERIARLLPTLTRDVARSASPLLLAPERRMAEQVAAWLAGHLPVAYLPAELDPRERRVWDDAVAAEPARVLIGTWPVLAVPVQRPARLVLLDAGSDAYKLRAGARTWIPHAAHAWSETHDVPLTLLDVLPDPETVALADAPQASVTLSRPAVRWVLSDLTRSRSWPIGDEAIRVLRQVQERHRQALILVPRRGFSAAMGCRDCGAAVMCPNCDLALRWHARDGRLRCHQCGYDTPPPRTCPDCGGHDLEAQRAAGSEWVLRSLEGVTPDLPRYRYDGDVRDDLTPLLHGEPGVLVGTTALLRTPPLPVLSLLLVSQIDGTLHADDFRAEMRVLRLLARLEERAGDRRPLGMIQTFAADHDALRAFTSSDPEVLPRELARMNERRARFGYPPHGRFALLQASAKRASDAWNALEEAAARLRTAGAEAGEILGPAPAPVARIRGRALAHLILKTHGDARRHELLRAAMSDVPRGVTLRVDVDPRDIGEVLE